MKTLIRKELRENLKIGVLGMIVFTLMLLQNYHTASAAWVDAALQSYSGQMAEKVQPLLGSGFLIQTVFFCAILGAVLGWIQIFNERHRDLWAFLVHRPMTRAEIFYSKAVAGVTLYLSAAGIPLLCLWTWIWLPGHIAAPFEWRMVIPSASSFLAGLICYCAGMLTGLRQARWYASRGLGIAAAIVVCLAIQISSSLWQPLIAISLGVVALGVAAWGAFQTGGYSTGQPLRGKIALAISLTIGSAAVVFLIFGLLASMALNRGYSWSYYAMTREGVVYKIAQAQGKPAEIVDLEGKPLMDEKTHRMMQLNDFYHRVAPSSQLNVDFESRVRELLAQSSRYFLLWKSTPDTIWYFWNEYGRLIGYDLASRRAIGSIGPEGFSASLAGSGAQFGRPVNHNPWNGLNLLNTETSVYDVDVENRAVKAVFNTPGDDPVGGAITVERPPASPATLVATRHFVQMVEFDGRVLWKIPYQPAYPDYASISYHSLEASNRFGLWFTPANARNHEESFKKPIHLLWLDSHAEILRAMDLPSQNLRMNADLGAVQSMDNFLKEKPNWKRDIPSAPSEWGRIYRYKSLREFLKGDDHVNEIIGFLEGILDDVAEFKNANPKLFVI